MTVLSACSPIDPQISNDEIIAEVMKCERAGLAAVARQSSWTYRTIGIDCSTERLPADFRPRCEPGPDASFASFPTGTYVWGTDGGGVEIGHGAIPAEEIADRAINAVKP